MRFARAWAAAALVGVASLQSSAGAADKSPFEGAWNVTMPRPGWDPPLVTGNLVLSKSGSKWSGDLTFVKVIGGRKQTLLDVTVKGTDVAFRIDAGPECDLRFDGKFEKPEISGRCAWKGCGDFKWTAVRADEKAVERFEKGLTFDGYLPKGDAEKLGMDGAALDQLVRDASSNDTDAVIVLRDGHVVAERYFGRPQTPIQVMSITKWVTAFAIAMLAEDKKLSLDAPLSTWFPEWTDGLRAKVTLRHVLTHTSGIEHGKGGSLINKEKDKVGYVRARPVTAEPGTVWEYNNEAISLLSSVVATSAGKQVDDFLRDRLFAPLDIKPKDWDWDRDAAGNAITYAQLSMSARGLARIGHLVVDGGKAGAKQLVAAESLALLATPATKVKDDQGLVWMLLFDDAKQVAGSYHTGSLGQWIVVLPKSKTVGVRLRRDKGGADAAKPEFEFGAFASRLMSAAK